MKVVTLYTRESCALCRVAFAQIQDLRTAHAFEVKLVDIDRDLAPDDARRSELGVSIPVVDVDGVTVCRHQVDVALLERALREGAEPR